MPNSTQSNNQILLDSIFESVPEDTFIFWKDIHSIYLGCNAHYAKLLGLSSPDDIIGKTDLDFYHTPDGDPPELFQKGDQQTLRGEHIQNQREWLSVAGKKILVLVSKAPLYQKSKLIGVLGVARDITERNRRDEELADTKCRLEGMTLVAASIAHELRTPLSSLALGIGNLQKYLPVLIEGYELAVKANQLPSKLKSSTLEIIKNSLGSMEREIELANHDISLLLKNIKPGVDNVSNECFSMVHCINDTLSRCPLEPEQRELIVWQPDIDFMVRGAEGLVTHILFNLIKNALHYIAEAGKGEVTISLEEGSSHNYLYFKDTGKGIPADILPHIFQQFFSRTYHGEGVGLSYCQKAMENLGGTITCDSEYGIYTLFKLTFPKLESKN